MILPTSVLLIIVFCAFILILLVDVSRLKLNLEKEVSGNLLTEYRGAQDEAMRRDCDLETVYSMDDAQCRNVCKTHGTYRTKNGRCVNVLVFETNSVQNKCSARDGVLAYLVGDPTFGKTKTVCLSVDLGIRPDRSDKENIICKDGTIDIDYVKTFPQLKDCKCKNDKILGLIESTRTIRTHGVCMDNKLLQIMNANNLLYKNTV